MNIENAYFSKRGIRLVKLTRKLFISLVFDYLNIGWKTIPSDVSEYVALGGGYLWKKDKFIIKRGI